MLQRASPVLSGVPPCRTAWSAREQHKTANMVRHWTERCGNSQVSRRFVTMLQCFLVRAATHCGSFRNDDILQCSEQFCSLYPLRTCFSNATLRQHWYCGKCKCSLWTQGFLHVAQLCGYCQVRR